MGPQARETTQPGSTTALELAIPAEPVEEKILSRLAAPPWAGVGRPGVGRAGVRSPGLATPWLLWQLEGARPALGLAVALAAPHTHVKMQTVSLGLLG